MIGESVVKRLAVQVGFNDRHGRLRVVHSNGSWVDVTDELAAFAHAIAEHQREIDAEIADDWAAEMGIECSIADSILE